MQRPPTRAPRAGPGTIGFIGALVAMTMLCGCGRINFDAGVDATADAAFDPSALVGVAAGAQTTCTWNAGGAVKCWGANDVGQLGVGSAVPFEDSAVGVNGLDDVRQVGGGLFNFCATRSAGVSCWGSNASGQLGPNGGMMARAPVDVPGLDDVVEVDSGQVFSCARRANGQIACWGHNGRGWLGNSGFTNSQTPVAVTSIDDAVQLAVGSLHTCARRAGGSVVCWGRNDEGQIGDGGIALTYNAPTAVAGLTDAIDVASGYMHTCALRRAGTVSCWGSNSNTQLGRDLALTGSNIPIDLPLSGVIGVSAGAYHTCAALTSGGIACWGSNNNVQLGQVTPIIVQAQPLDVPMLPSALEVTGGFQHTCARVDASLVKCWGRNEAGQVGDGSTDNPRPTPVSVVGLP